MRPRPLIALALLSAWLALPGCAAGMASVSRQFDDSGRLVAQTCTVSGIAIGRASVGTDISDSRTAEDKTPPATDQADGTKVPTPDNRIVACAAIDGGAASGGFYATAGALAGALLGGVVAFLATHGILL